jgi:hypothetical protein
MVAPIAYAADQERKKQNVAKNLGNAEQQRAQAEQKRLEDKYGTLTDNETNREARQYGLEKDRQAEYERRAGMSGQDLIAEEGDVNQNLINSIRRRQGMTGEQLFADEGELNQKIGREALSDDPYALLAPELELARQSVNAEANRRGVFGGNPEGGIRFEQLGRANVDLAVKAAAQRIAQRNALASQYLSLGQGARGDAGTLAERSLSTKERARAELQGFLGDTQNQSANARNRTTGAGMQAAQIADAGISRGYNTKVDVAGQQAGVWGGYKNQMIDFAGDAATAGMGAMTGSPSGLGGVGKTPTGSSSSRLSDLSGSELDSYYKS